MKGKSITIITAILSAALCVSLAFILISCKKKEDIKEDVKENESFEVTEEEKEDEIKTPEKEEKKEENEKEEKEEFVSNLSRNGTYVFANGKEIEVPKGVGVYEGIVVGIEEGRRIDIEDPSKIIYSYEVNEEMYVSDEEEILHGDKATVYYDKDITEALYIVIEHD